MKRVFTVSLCLFAIMAFSSTSFAQEFSISQNEVQPFGQIQYEPASPDAITITHSLDQSIVALTGVACTSGGITSDNQYWRAFVLADFGITDEFNVTNVEFGIETAVGGVGGDQPMTVNLYTTDLVFPTGTLTLIGTLDVMVPDQDLTLYQIPVTGTAPAGSELVVEISIPADVGDGNVFYPGANSLGETADSWISSVGCGITTPITYTDLGFPTCQLVMNVTGDVVVAACGLLTDNFDADIAQWTIVGPLGLTNWSWVFDNQAAGADSGEMEFNWSPSFTGDSYIMSPVLPSAGWINTTISFQHFVDNFTSGYTVGCATTTDGGTSWTTVWSVSPSANVGPEAVTVPFTGDANLQIGFFFSGSSVSIDYWYIDDVCVDGTIPVELTSFTASVNGKNVTLNWVTATETNNQGFEIERNSGNGFQNVGYVAGFGTSAEPHSYSFIDASLSEGTHSYRLKQLDFDGTFHYFDAINVDITIPDVFALAQNYPNPFNPSTKIDFSLAVDSKVSLTVFDVLGQEVANLVNTDLAAGSHNVDFNASLLNSGVYFYRIEATGIDGTNFTNVKKMILTK